MWIQNGENIELSVVEDEIRQCQQQYDEVNQREEDDNEEQD